MDLDWFAFSRQPVSDPYPYYAALRERDPVHASESQGIRFWHLTRYADVVSVLRDPRISAERFPQKILDAAIVGPDAGFAALAGIVSNVMLAKDPPRHTRLRGLVSKAFTPRMIEALRPRIESLVDELLDAVEAKGSFELVVDLAAPLPIVVIAELLGVPASDRGDFKRWSDDFVPFIDGSIRDQGLLVAAKAAEAFTKYFTQVIEDRRSTPRDDLMSALVASEDEGDKLSRDEVIASAVLLLAAGHETTTNLIGNGMLALLRHRDQFERLRHETDLGRSAVEELLRYDAPVQMTSRRSKEDFEIGGKRIPPGEEINVLLGAANHDPAQFSEPDRLDLARNASLHLAFGHGAHFCLGSTLARIEAQVAFERIVRRFPRLDLTSEAPSWKAGVVLRGVKALPLRF
jgi:cytochrome P450